jgi:ferric-dicitrate binding protein FerR (iron transport regulator)
MIEGDDRGDDRYARKAAQLLRGSMEWQAESQPADVRRDAVVAAMALAIAAKARRRRTVAVTAVVFAAAASVLLVFRLTGNSGLPGVKPGADMALVVEQASGRGNQLERATSTQPLLDRGVLLVGDSVHSGTDSSAILGFANGTRISLSSSAHLRVDDLGPTRRFSLFRGSLQAHVAKLGQGERFIVSTPSSEVEVRGTVFTVAVDSSPSRCHNSNSSSTVSVSEGAVWVRSGDKQVVLQPGDSWVTPCYEPRNAAPEVVVRAPVVMPSESRPSVRAPVHKVVPASVSSTAAPTPDPQELPVAPSLEPTRIPTPPAAVSRLAEQNDLFSAAMAAERQGQHDLALSKLDDLIGRYPVGPLSESARAERQRILSAK